MNAYSGDNWTVDFSKAPKAESYWRVEYDQETGTYSFNNVEAEDKWLTQSSNSYHPYYGKIVSVSDDNPYYKRAFELISPDTPAFDVCDQHDEQVVKLHTYRDTYVTMPEDGRRGQSADIREARNYQLKCSGIIGSDDVNVSLIAQDENALSSGYDDGYVREAATSLDAFWEVTSAPSRVFKFWSRYNDLWLTTSRTAGWDYKVVSIPENLDYKAEYSPDTRRQFLLSL
ncbi:hypothetical protein SG34_030245 [Thalassomonas viridans]|uniref:Uncharacterized protein n=1 Tax=Thalassomonas viridans TaxID=137584 RepID=A0AAF0CDC6_9GAMM|nr:hypothetical protein [Thalassomonas viridans]WDE09058.1 hypothetical protein SG34_030245 [Thalassomonas viridans]